MAVHRIASNPGRRHRQEVITAGLEVLAALQARTPRLEVATFDWGSQYYRRHGRMMPEDGLDRLRPFDAIYFGAVGAPDIPDDVTLWGLRLAICQGFDQYANVRPARLLPGVTSPLRGVRPRPRLDRRAREHGGRIRRRRRSGASRPARGGWHRACRVHPRRLCPDHALAFDLARSRPRRRLTLVTKSNAQRHGMVLWDETFAEVAREFRRWRPTRSWSTP